MTSTTDVHPHPAAMEPGPAAPHAAAVGSLVALALCGLVTVVGAVVSDVGWGIGLVGLPGTTVLAWRAAPVVARETSWTWRRSLGFAWRVIAVTDLLVVAFLLIASVPNYLENVAAGPSLAWAGDLIVGAGMAIALLPVMWVLGLLIFGWMGAIFVIPLAWLWGSAVRAMTR
jgi:hypothetical protein